jgi:hypothetical protein
MLGLQPPLLLLLAAACRTWREGPNFVHRRSRHLWSRMMRSPLLGQLSRGQRYRARRSCSHTVNDVQGCSVLFVMYTGRRLVDDPTDTTNLACRLRVIFSQPFLLILRPFRVYLWSRYGCGERNRLGIKALFRLRGYYVRCPQGTKDTGGSQAPKNIEGREGHPKVGLCIWKSGGAEHEQRFETQPLTVGKCGLLVAKPAREQLALSYGSSRGRGGGGGACVSAVLCSVSRPLRTGKRNCSRGALQNSGS